MEPALHDQVQMVRALQRFLEQPAEMLETHISWVLLSGEFAYKIKKAVNLGFLDFSTLEKRGYYCAEEVRLNLRLAPELYLEVTAITGGAESPALNGSGPDIDYAVKMRRFPQSCLLDQVLQRDELSPATADAIARKVADFHGRVEIAHSGIPFGTPERVHQPATQNFAQIRTRLGEQGKDLDVLELWSEQMYRSLFTAFATRKALGFIRECHGDLHLGNIMLLNGQVVPFDCIEFNEDLRWIDVISEAAFLAMDLFARERPGLARRFLNAYLEQTGDYAGLEVLRYYLVYRAMVRAKVACIRAEQEGPAGGRDDPGARFHHYIRLAASFTRHTRPFLAINHGLSGSGKTTLTQSLLEEMDLFRVRSDVERKRLYGLKPEARSSAGMGEGIYSPEAGRRTYRRLAELARSIIRSGYPVVVDAAFLRRRERTDFQELAQELGVPFVILDFEAPERLLRERVKQRLQSGHDASEAIVAVLESQIRNREPLQGAELAQSIKVDTEQAADAKKLADRLAVATSCR